MANLRAALNPGIAGWGFALFLAVNAVSVWGGVFPFLPMEFQTIAVTLSFYGAQAFSALVMFVASLVCSFVSPQVTARVLPVLAAPPMVVGSVALIAAMYVNSLAAIMLVIVAGILLGLGSTSMALLWQRTFASYADDRGDILLVVGTGLSALIYFALYLCPVAVTAYLVPLVFLPLCAASLTVSTRGIDLDQPMFTDVPRNHPAVYRRFVRDYWRSCLAAGAVSFVAGITRAIALADVTAGHVVNVTSMLGALASAAVIIVLWQRFSFHLSMRKAYRWIFPILTFALVMLPMYEGMAYVDVFAGAVWAAYAFVQMVLLVQCAQASRARGVCPVVTYAFCSGIIHAMQFIGFILGWGTDLVNGLGMEQLTLASLLAVWVLGLVLYTIWIRPRKPLSENPRPSPDAVEFVSLATEPRGTEIPVRPVVDRLTKQCEAIRTTFRLSDREAEVMELVARGDTVARIAEKLEVSENTVRTHTKRIYTKLGIHSKQELSDLVQSFEPARV